MTRILDDVAGTVELEGMMARTLDFRASPAQMAEVISRGSSNGR